MEESEDCLLFYEMDDLIDASLPRMYDVRLCRLPDKPFVFTNEFMDENAEFALTGSFPSFTPWLDPSTDKMILLPYGKSL